MNDKFAFRPRSEEDSRARAFIDARQNGKALATYPGRLPETLGEAYDVQDTAIRLFGRSLAGWKVGRINGHWQEELGQDRLAGPIFEGQVHAYGSGSIAMPVFKGGFAAVEAEITFRIVRDAPADKTEWTAAEARQMIASAHLGIEIASSPFAGINEKGPLVTISDFGNNNGLIVAGERLDLDGSGPADWACTLSVAGQSFGPATPDAMPGGPVESLRFLLENTARRGLPLRKDMMICTGAVTGVHEARIGDPAEALCGPSIVKCHLTAA